MGEIGGNPAERCSQEVDQPAGQQGGQSPRHAQRKGDSRGERGQHDPHAEQANQRRTEDFHQRQKRDQRQRNGSQAAEQAGSGHQPPHVVRKKSAGEFEDAAGHNCAHPHMPGMAGRRFALHPACQSRCEGGADHEKHHPECAGGIEPQRHRRDIAAAGSPGEPKSHPGKEEIPHHHANGSARHEVRQGKLCRVVKDGGQQRNGQHEIGQIVERESEKGIHIAGSGPAVRTGRGIHGQFSDGNSGDPGSVAGPQGAR